MASHATQLKIGLFGIGLHTYWPQFAGLKDRLTGHQQRIRDGLEAGGAAVVDAGLVDNLDGSAHAAFNSLPSREEKTGEWLAHCQACSAPEIASVFNRAGIDYHLVTGTLDDPAAWAEIRDWVDAAEVARVFRATRIGLMGHYYGGMLDVYSDYTQMASSFGNHFELVEIDELRALHDAASEVAVDEMLARLRGTFDVSGECSEAELRRAARTSAGLHKLAAKRRLGALAYYYEGQPGSEHEAIMGSVIAGNTLLTANHAPVAGEHEVKNVIAMKILDALGAGGSFSNSRYRFPIGAKAYVNAWAKAGPSHHCAIGVGHVAGKLEKLAEILGTEYQLVC